MNFQMNILLARMSAMIDSRASPELLFLCFQEDDDQEEGDDDKENDDIEKRRIVWIGLNTLLRIGIDVSKKKLV